MEFLKSSHDNRIARLLFVDYWADFVKTHTDEEWGRQHTDFINSLMQNAKHYPLTAKQYLKIKEEVKKEMSALKSRK